jgi:hypothetical protein
MHKILSRHK